MASVKTSALVADIKGKVGGNVFARNKAGIYVRSRVVPINPRSVLQQTRRATAAAAAARWGQITVQQRADWQAYALNTSWTNRLGDAINIGGEAAFIRVATYALLRGSVITDAAPLAFGHASATVSTITASAGTQTPILADPSAGFQGDVDSTFLNVFAAMPQPGSRDMAPVRFRFLQYLQGASGGPIGFPFTLDTWPWTYQEDQKITIALVQVNQLNQVSVRTTFSVIAAA